MIGELYKLVRISPPAPKSGPVEGAGVAVGVGMGVAVEAGCEQPIVTGRTKAMAIPISNNALGRMSNATTADNF